jgi:hypothetical protein
MVSSASKPTWTPRTIVRTVAIVVALLVVASCIQFAVSIRALGATSPPARSGRSPRASIPTR